MLEIVGLEKSFGSRKVLAGATLSVSAGESVALIGSNGCGKTTTLRCAVGLARPDRGTIRVAGLDAVTNGREARRHLSYLPQKPMFPPTLTVRETVAFAAQLRGLRGAVVDRELALCELEPLAERFVGNLSGGERQRLALAVVFVADVGLYLFDEPTSHLDPAATTMLAGRAGDLKLQGRAIVFTTHHSSDVEMLATRVVMLRDGRFAEYEWGADFHQGDAAPARRSRILTGPFGRTAEIRRSASR